MTAEVVQLPGTTPAVQPQGLNLTFKEVVDASGGYVRAADQLRALQARGFVRAWRTDHGKGPVILERGHYEAVTRGQFGPAPAANEPGPRAPVAPNRAAFRAKFGGAKKA